MATDDNSSTSLPVDRHGGGTPFDPSKNVLDLVESAISRIDDLRAAETIRVNDLIANSFKTTAALRLADNVRIEEMATIRATHLKEIITLTTTHAKELMVAEAKRIDAIRVVDVQAVQTANEKATAQASVLASQVQVSGDTLRTLMSTNAAALATQLTQIITPITDRLASLEKAQYEGAGKSGVVDPQITQLLSEMRVTQETMAKGSGRSDQAQEGRGNLTTAISIAIAAIAVTATVVTLIINLNKPAMVAQPAVVERVIVTPPATNNDNGNRNGQFGAQP